MTLLPGGCFFHHADSFAMMRGGHLDVCVLGAFQVSAGGDLANWHTGAPDAIPAVGGAMDLAIGAKKTLVMMEHCTKAGESKIVRALQLPAHRRWRCVSRVYTDLAVIDLGPQGATVVEMCEGLDAGATAGADGGAVALRPWGAAVSIGASRALSSYWISLSAWFSNTSGSATPMRLAVFRLITSSNFVGCSIGSSAGLAPFRILST